MDLSNVPRFVPLKHTRTSSRSPTRSPTRQRITDDLLTDLSPSTTLEAFTNPSGKLKASIEAATTSERAFGLRATLASKKIQEWVDELSAWSWPKAGGSEGFELPTAKRRKLNSSLDDDYAQDEYMGSLPMSSVLAYETRIEDIQEDMEDLNVEEIKSTVLNNHFIPKSRPSSSSSNASSMTSNYTKMDDFTAMVTATVLQSLPNLGRLMRLMDVWSIRLNVLRKVPPLLELLDDAEIALKSGWTAIELGSTHDTNRDTDDAVLERKTFEIMRDVLQDKVTTLGQDLDYMLDTLEGRDDTLPEHWLDRMEKLETEYGEWVVSGDRKVREGEWARMAKARQAERDRLKVEEDARQSAERERREEEERLRLEEEEERLRLLEEERLWMEREAQLTAQKARNAEEELLRLEEEKRLEAARVQKEKEEALRLEQEKADAARLAAEEARQLEESRLREEQIAEAAEIARIEADQARIEEEKAVEAARLEAEETRKREEAAELARLTAELEQLEREQALKLEQERVAEAARVESEQARQREEFRLRELEAARAAETARQAEDARIQKEKALQLEQEKAAESARLEAEEASRREELLRQRQEAELARQEAEKQASLAEAAQLRAEEADREAARLRDEASGAAELERQQAEQTRLEKEETLRLHQQGALESARLEAAAFQERKEQEHGFRREAEAARQQAVGVSSYQEREYSQHIHESDASILRSLPVIAAAGLATMFGADSVKSYANQDLEVSNGTLPSRSPVSKITLFDGSDGPTNADIRRPTTPKTPVQDQNSATHDQQSSKTPSTPRTPSPTLALEEDVAVQSPSNRLEDGRTLDQDSSGSPKNARLGHALSELLRKSSPPIKTATKSPSLQLANLSPSPALPPKSPRRVSGSFTRSRSDTANDGTRDEHELGDERVVDSPEEYLSPHHHPEDRTRLSVDLARTHTRNSSVASYDSSAPTPEVLVAEPAEYFRPILTPIKSSGFLEEDSRPTTPSRSPYRLSSIMNVGEISPTIDTDLLGMEDSPALPIRRRPTIERASHASHDGASESKLHNPDLCLDEWPLSTISRPSTGHKSPIRVVETPRRTSISSNTSTIVTRQAAEAMSSPAPSSPITNHAEQYEESPTAGRDGQRNASYDYTPPGSPPLIPAMSKRRSLIPPRSPARSSAGSPILEPSTPSSEAPVFESIELSPELPSSPRKFINSSDDQLQAQIYSVLESLPTRIHLTSEPYETPFLPVTPQTDSLRPQKTRRSLGPSSIRSHSSLSSRAPTPSFTLAPAYGKGASRQRPQSNHPEIKLYHLSRSTGEAPIKLFVRLVGENGERVMVRVGGGWADLGEYLREYASHHGRRAGHTEDKVEIQNLGSRNVSGASTARGNGRNSPAPASRPGSVLGIERPLSSLFVRKTRKSDADKTESLTFNIQSPSTPVTFTSQTAGRATNSESPNIGTGTPNSEKSRRASNPWIEEDGGLGLAGPKGKNRGAISERDLEWVELMKEKVRLASAEKERAERPKVERKKSLGELNKVGATKRLFRKG
jgi:hypothetical protein